MATYLNSSVLFVAFPTSPTPSPKPQRPLSWVLNTYTIICGSANTGRQARVGPKQALLVGALIFAAASMACGLSPSIEILIFARIIQGLGITVLVPSSLALVLAAYPREELPQVVAIWGAMELLGRGPFRWWIIVNGLGWRWIFFMNLPIRSLLILGTKYPESHETLTFEYLASPASLW